MMSHDLNEGASPGQKNKNNLNLQLQQCKTVCAVLINGGNIFMKMCLMTVC